MPLTPEDVQNKEFTTVRLREGYDMTEVDEFLDEVEAELARLNRENEELRDKLAAVTRGGPITAAEPVGAMRPGAQPPQVPPAPQPQAKPPVAPGMAGPPGVVGATPHEAAAKVLALAQKTADELVADAKAEAERLLTDARSRAQQLDADTKMKANKLETELRERRQQMETESQQRREQILGQLEVERERLDMELEGLRGFEREYRSRLKAYLEGQLRHLEASGAADTGMSTGPVQPVGAPAGHAGPAVAAGQVGSGGPGAQGGPGSAGVQNSNSSQHQQPGKPAEASAAGRVSSLLEEDQPRG